MYADRRPRSDALPSLVRGMRTSVRNNSGAYGYSVTITASFAMLVTLGRPPRVWEIFLFVVGAAAAFASVEAVASKGFRVTGRTEPAEVALLGAALSFVSINIGLGAAALVAWLVPGWPAWPLGAFAATASYLCGEGLDFAVAERLDE